ncbi:M48 family metallopeptidase [Fusibacter ferrireducens]|uniref:M48 family metallopeptidase n=1 Tax=Fusibacter ferrireducens TaxID=2785058 RepID=A0ABR9ZV70_9FIRM|nr:SprT family zinc-dependent metalloprotease [Fusibacter ferrireducens]MBF4693795.1 M48 family metallopeptidase [Fusibacter ferrireducens]
MKINVVKSNRKTCEIRVERDGSVTVKAPKRYTSQMIKAILEDKADWIDRKVEWMKTNALLWPPLNFEIGSTVPIWYEDYRITISDSVNSYLDQVHKRIMIRSTVAHEAEAIKQEIIKLLRVFLKNYLIVRVKMWSDEMQLNPNEIRIKLMRSRWGSCSSKGNLNFSLNLVLLPKEIVDYIIVHELAHLKELNHSKRFWEVVERYYPLYAERKKWLNINTFNLKLN